MTDLRIAALLRKLDRTRELTKRRELEYQLAALGYVKPEDRPVLTEPPVERRAPEHVTAATVPPKRSPGRPRKQSTA